MHELDIQLESHLDRYFNMSLIGGELNKNFFVQAKRHESVRENLFRRVLGNLHTNLKCSVSKSICELDVVKQDFKSFRTYFHSKKVQYIRYVDHFILASVGDKKSATNMLVFIAIILGSLGMTLSIEKSGVKSSVEGVVFLGYHIYSLRLFDAK